MHCQSQTTWTRHTDKMSDKMKTRLQVISQTILIETMEGNSDVQLRRGKDGFYMTSPKTGIHFIQCNNGEITKRVEIHWNGFKQNQNI